MGNCIISYKNWVTLSETTVSASSEASGLGVNRLKDPQLRKRWRTAAGVTAPNLTFDFQATKECGVLFLAQPDDAGSFNSNNEPTGAMAATDTVRHRLDATTSGAGVLLDTTAISGGWKAGYYNHLYKLSNAVNARYWRVDLNAISLATTPGYIDLGFAWAGPAFVPTYNMIWGWQWMQQDGSIISNVQASGLDYIRKGWLRRVITIAFDALTAAEADALSEMDRLVGTNAPVLFVPDPDDTTYGFTRPIVGRLAEPSPLSLPAFGTYAKALSIIQNK